jgi:predicted amidohydrolase
LIKGGQLVDPAIDRPGPSDLLFDGGRVAQVGQDLTPPRGAQVVDAAGLLVMPAWSTPLHAAHVKRCCTQSRAGAQVDRILRRVTRLS